MQMIAAENLPGNAMSPAVRVGDVTIDEDAIAQEMQYHPAASVGEAQLLAARALVVRELLSQRAALLGLAEPADDRTIAELLERELEVPEPDEAACRRFFETHRQRFSEPTRLRIRHILLPAAPDDAPARDAQYRLGQTLIQQLQEVPERFSEFAQRHSACPTKDEGGDLGWLLPGQTVGELDRALAHLPTGLYERPLASRYGWHVVYVDERIEGHALPFAQVAERVRHTLLEQSTRRALRHYLLALEETVGVEGIALDDDSTGSLMQ
nr:peptidylprolyl isomerase [uncultured Halomonas sp.]